MGEELDRIRREMRGWVGQPVELTSSMRRRTHRAQGVIDGAYETVFTVVMDCCGEKRRTCYTYVDLFTKAVSVKRLA